MGKVNRGSQCCALGCCKRVKVDADKSELRSDSEGEIDEESHIKRSFPRSFHRY